MTRVAGCLGVLLLLATIGHAQDRAGVEDDRGERLDTYLRSGRYADARRLIDDMLRAGPRADLESTRAVFATAPNMRVRRASASFSCDVRGGGVRLPATVNGRPVRWLMDTGAGVTIISDAEAVRLGLEIQDSQGRAVDMAGGSTSIRTAIARRVIIGGSQFEDVLFLITPADRMPWKELPPGQQGILGLPLFIGLDALRWTRTGMCHSGSAARDAAPTAIVPSNLRYDGLHVIIRATLNGKTLEFVLDSGNQAGTQLWERFGQEFDSYVKEHGRKGAVRVTQFGGSNEHAITRLPEMRLTIGGRETHLAEGKLFARPVGNDRVHGLLGMDILSQAAEVTIDFRAMSLTMR